MEIYWNSNGNLMEISCVRVCVCSCVLALEAECGCEAEILWGRFRKGFGQVSVRFRIGFGGRNSLGKVSGRFRLGFG